MRNCYCRSTKMPFSTPPRASACRTALLPDPSSLLPVPASRRRSSCLYVYVAYALLVHLFSAQVDEYMLVRPTNALSLARQKTSSGKSRSTVLVPAAAAGGGSSSSSRSRANSRPRRLFACCTTAPSSAEGKNVVLVEQGQRSSGSAAPVCHAGERQEGEAPLQGQQTTSVTLPLDPDAKVPPKTASAHLKRSPTPKRGAVFDATVSPASGSTTTPSSSSSPSFSPGSGTTGGENTSDLKPDHGRSSPSNYPEGRSASPSPIEQDHDLIDADLLICPVAVRSCVKQAKNRVQATGHTSCGGTTGAITSATSTTSRSNSKASSSFCAPVLYSTSTSDARTVRTFKKKVHWAPEEKFEIFFYDQPEREGTTGEEEDDEERCSCHGKNSAKTGPGGAPLSAKARIAGGAVSTIRQIIMLNQYHRRISNQQKTKMHRKEGRDNDIKCGRRNTEAEELQEGHGRGVQHGPNTGAGAVRTSSKDRAIARQCEELWGNNGQGQGSSSRHGYNFSYTSEDESEDGFSSSKPVRMVSKPRMLSRAKSSGDLDVVGGNNEYNGVEVEQPQVEGASLTTADVEVDTGSAPEHMAVVPIQRRKGRKDSMDKYDQLRKSKIAAKRARSREKRGQDTGDADAPAQNPLSPDGFQSAGSAGTVSSVGTSSSYNSFSSCSEGELLASEDQEVRDVRAGIEDIDLAGGVAAARASSSSATGRCSLATTSASKPKIQHLWHRSPSSGSVVANTKGGPSPLCSDDVLVQRCDEGERGDGDTQLSENSNEDCNFHVGDSDCDLPPAKPIPASEPANAGAVPAASTAGSTSSRGVASACSTRLSFATKISDDRKKPASSSSSCCNPDEDRQLLCDDRTGVVNEMNPSVATTRNRPQPGKQLQQALRGSTGTSSGNNVAGVASRTSLAGTTSRDSHQLPWCGGLFFASCSDIALATAGGRCSGATAAGNASVITQRSCSGSRSSTNSPTPGTQSPKWCAKHGCYHGAGTPGGRRSPTK
ncbi:unnamed protein product [Amoebophrya sp. A120]|nr:unnamed protein product [Amoebophrya sp. A120]|eukprot:GSA120T00009938001.1